MFQLISARDALAHAQREVERLRAIPAIGLDFSDHVAWALDRTHHVTRQITAEAKKRGTTPGFKTWWDALLRPVDKYRNDALKGPNVGPDQVPVVRLEATLRFPNGAVTVYDVSVTTDDGVTVHGREITQVPEGGEVAWYFRDGPWAGQPVIEALDARLQELRDVIIPEAERLLA